MKAQKQAATVVDPDKMHTMAMKMVTELGAAAMGSLVLTGDKLGVYEALTEGGPADATALAERTSCHERYVREWLSANAADRRCICCAVAWDKTPVSWVSRSRHSIDCSAAFSI